MSTPILSTPTSAQASLKMALLRRPGSPPELIEEAVAANDVRLAERYPGLLENALALRERFTLSGARVRDPKQTNQGQLFVTVVQEAVLEIEGQRVWIVDLNDVRTEEKTRDTAVLLQTWARQALIEQAIETTPTGPRAVIRIIKQAATKGGHGDVFRNIIEEKNVARQNFCYADVRREQPLHKATSMAFRLGMTYGIEYRRSD